MTETIREAGQALYETVTDAHFGLGHGNWGRQTASLKAEWAGAEEKLRALLAHEATPSKAPESAAAVTPVMTEEALLTLRDDWQTIVARAPAVAKTQRARMQAAIEAALRARSASAGGWDLARAFDVGFSWGRRLQAQHLTDSRDVMRTLGSDDFAGLELSWIDGFKTVDEGIVEAKAAIKTALNALSAQAIAPPDTSAIEIQDAFEGVSPRHYDPDTDNYRDDINLRLHTGVREREELMRAVEDRTRARQTPLDFIARAIADIDALVGMVETHLDGAKALAAAPRDPRWDKIQNVHPRPTMSFPDWWAIYRLPDWTSVPEAAERAWDAAFTTGRHHSDQQPPTTQTKGLLIAWADGQITTETVSDRLADSLGTAAKVDDPDGDRT